MKRTTICLAAAALCMAGAAKAEELEAAADAEARSLSGEMLRAASQRVRAKRGAADNARVEAARREIERRGLVSALVAGKRHVWHASAHPELDRVVLQRVLAEGELPASADQRLERMRARQGRLSRAQLLARANEVAQALQQTAPSGATEDLVPVRVGATAVGFATKTSTSTYLHRHRVLLRRYIGSVPVLGREGEIQVSFDLEGNLEEVAVPTSIYQPAADTFAAQPGRNALERSFARAGLGRAPRSRNDSIVRDGKPVDTGSMLCGYYDDGESEALVRGCFVDVKSEASAEQIFVPADE